MLSLKKKKPKKGQIKIDKPRKSTYAQVKKNAIINDNPWKEKNSKTKL